MSKDVQHFLRLALALKWQNRTELGDTIREIAGETPLDIPAIRLPLVTNLLRVEAYQLGMKLFPQVNWSFARLEIYRNAPLGRISDTMHIPLPTAGVPQSLEDPKLKQALHGISEMKNKIRQKMEELVLRTEELTICQAVLNDALAEIPKPAPTPEL